MSLTFACLEVLESCLSGSPRVVLVGKSSSHACREVLELCLSGSPRVMFVSCDHVETDVLIVRRRIVLDETAFKISFPGCLECLRKSESVT